METLMQALQSQADITPLWRSALEELVQRNAWPSLYLEGFDEEQIWAQVKTVVMGK
jgi:hypothetical protein